MKKYQDGFGLVEILLIVVVAGILAGLGFVAYRTIAHNSASSQSSTTKTQTSSTSPKPSATQASTCVGSFTDNPSAVAKVAGYTAYTESNSHIIYNQADVWGTPEVTIGTKNQEKYANGETVPSFIASMSYRDFDLTISTISDYYFFGRYVGWDYSYDACAKSWTSRIAAGYSGADQYKLPTVTMVNDFPVAEFTLFDAGSASITYSLPVNNTYIFEFIWGGDYTGDEQFAAQKAHLLQEVQDFINSNKQFTK